MANEISNIAAAGAGMAAQRPTAPPPPASNGNAQANAAPKVQAPKPAAVQFDPAELLETVQEAVGLLNKQIKAGNRDLGFHVDEELGRPIVTVRSIETGEVVRQIPTEVIVSVAHNIERMKGLLFSAKS